MDAWREDVLAKAASFFGGAAARAIRCIQKKDPLHFGIAHKAPLSRQHLEALILYTDFSDFSTAFSASFRPAHRGESLAAIKRRHSRFCRIARWLCELVQYFGRRGCRNLNGKDAGPFWCGMSRRLCVPEFAMRLNGPTSTSKDATVAARFAGA